MRRPFSLNDTTQEADVASTPTLERAMFMDISSEHSPSAPTIKDTIHLGVGVSHACGLMSFELNLAMSSFSRSAFHNCMLMFHSFELCESHGSGPKGI